MDNKMDALYHPKKLLDKILSTRKGVEIEFESTKLALAFRHKIYKVRKLDREKCQEIYAKTETEVRSPYESIVVRLDDKKMKVTFENPDAAAGILVITELK